MSKDLKDMLDSHYARKVKMGEVTYAQVPSEYREEVKRELEANGFTLEMEASS